MATAAPILTQYQLGEKRPIDWKAHQNHYVILFYEIDSSGALVFTYREMRAPLRSAAVRSFGEFSIASLSAPQPILNLDVYSDCFLEVWLNPRQNWQWPRQLDAITNKQDFSTFYFELTYREGTDLYKRPDFPKDKVPLVARFGARHNAGAPKGTKHGFSLNLELLYPAGDPLPITIDPDIKNPSS